jgi:cyclase
MRANRRTILRATLGSAGCLALPAALRPVFAQEPIAPESGDPALTQAESPAMGVIESTRLRGNLWLLRGAGVNSVALTGVDGGVLLVDGGLAAHADALLQAVRGLPDSGPVHTLINTHWHPEQTGANDTLGRAGARIIAHENTRLWLTTDITRPWETVTHDPLPEVARPNDTFYSTESFILGDETVECFYLRQAHTDGDIGVLFRNANVLLTGDVASGAGWPFMDWWTGGWISGLAEGVRTLQTRVDADTLIVPAQGALLTQAELEFQREAYQTLSVRLRQMLNRGYSPAEAVEAQPASEFTARLGPADDFVRLAFQSLWGHLSPDA